MGVAINPKFPWSVEQINASVERVNAVIYARYSSHSQGEQSIEGQLEKAHLYAAAKGYNVVHEYVDRAQSGRTDKRDEFQKMLKDTAKKQFQVIILWKVDRFGRNREEIALNKIKCKKNGVRVEYVAEQIPDTPEGVILESVLEGFAEYYSLQLSQNIRRGQQVSREKCQSTGGVRPLGYTVDKNKRYVIDPETAPIVKLIFTMYAEGSTVTEIIAHLNEKGYRNQQGKPFAKGSIYSVLSNEKYTGVYICGDQRTEGGIPQIIEPELFEKVKEMRKVNKRAPAHKWSRADYILTDKLFCGKCGTPMAGECGTSRNGNIYNYYLCSKKKRFKTCDKKAVRQDWIEPLVLREIKKLIFNDEILEFIAENTYRYYLSQNAAEEELRLLKSKLADVEQAITNIVRAVEAGMFNAALKNRMDELEAQKSDLLDGIAGVEIARTLKLTKDHILFFLLQFREMNLDDKERQKRIISTFVNSIFVFDDKIVLTFNYSGDSATITLSEIDAVTTGEVFGRCASCSTISENPNLIPFGNGFGFFIFLQNIVPSAVFFCRDRTYYMR